MHQVGKLNIKGVSFNKKEKRIKRRTCFDAILFVMNLLKKFVLNTCLRLLQTHLFFPSPLKLYECVFLCLLYLYLFCFLNRNFLSFLRKVIRENLKTSRESLFGTLVPLPISQRRSSHYFDRLHDFSVAIPRCYKNVYVNSFVPHAARLWNSVPRECFPFTYDLSGFKSRFNRHLLTVGSF